MCLQAQEQLEPPQATQPLASPTPPHPKVCACAYRGGNAAAAGSDYQQLNAQASGWAWIMLHGGLSVPSSGAASVLPAFYVRMMTLFCHGLHIPI